MNVLITGATSGIGRQLALDYHNDGHTVWAVGRSEEELQKLAQQGLNTLRVDLLDRGAALACFSSLETVDLAVMAAGSVSISISLILTAPWLPECCGSTLKPWLIVSKPCFPHYGGVRVHIWSALDRQRPICRCRELRPMVPPKPLSPI